MEWSLFHFNKKITAASNVAVRKYHKDTLIAKVRKEGVAVAMKSSIKDSTKKLYKKLSKIVVVANPSLGQDWLKEVECTHIENPRIVLVLKLLFNCYLIHVHCIFTDRAALEPLCSS